MWNFRVSLILSPFWVPSLPQQLVKRTAFPSKLRLQFSVVRLPSFDCRTDVVNRLQRHCSACSDCVMCIILFWNGKAWDPIIDFFSETKRNKTEITVDQWPKIIRGCSGYLNYELDLSSSLNINKKPRMLPSLPMFHMTWDIYSLCYIFHFRHYLPPLVEITGVFKAMNRPQMLEVFHMTWAAWFGAPVDRRHRYRTSTSLWSV